MASFKDPFEDGPSGGEESTCNGGGSGVFDGRGEEKVLSDAVCFNAGAHQESPCFITVCWCLSRVSRDYIHRPFYFLVWQFVFSIFNSIEIFSDDFFELQTPKLRRKLHRKPGRI